MFAITALLGAIVVTLFIFQVMIVVSDRESSPKPGEAWNEARDGTVETFESAGNILAAAVNVGSNIAGIITITIIFILLALLFMTALGVGIANFGDEISGAFDSTFTEVWPPFYRTVVLGIADPVLSLWNVILPVANSLNGSWRILRSNALQQAIDCPGADWGDVALKLRDTILSLLSSIVTWILELARNDFDLYHPLRDLQQAVENITPVAACWCEATSLVSNIASSAITSHELAAVIDRILNLIINIIKDLLGSITNIFVAFGRALFSGGNIVHVFGDYYWEPNRAPSIERTVRTLGQLVARLMDWLDDIVVAIASNFFTITDAEVPRLFGIFGNYIESIVLDINVFMDAISKPLRYLSLMGTRYANETWDKSRPVALRTQDLLTDAFVKAYNASALSESFFQTWTVPLAQLNDSDLADTAQVLLNLTGCMSHELLDVFTALIEIPARAFVATFHERLLGGDYGEYLRDSPFSDAIDVALSSSLRFSDCAAGFYSEIDDELGRLVNETGHVIVAIIDPFVALHENWNNRSHFWNSTLYSDLVDNAFFELDSWSIATGNFIRQFAFINDTIVDPETNCRIRDPHLEQNPPGTAPDMADWEAFYPWYVDPFCCLGGAFEEFFRLFFGFFEGITRAIVAFVAAPTFGDGFIASFKSGGPLDLRVEFLPMLDFLLRDLYRFSCIKYGIGRAIADAFFDGPTLPCGSGGDSFWEVLVEVTTGFLRTPIKVVVGGVAEIWSWMVSLVEGGACSENCWCTRLRAFYATTGGEIVDWAADLLDLIGCVFGSAVQFLTRLTDWAETLRSIFGSSGTLATGNFFCVITDFFTTIWDLFRCWSGGGGFVACIFETILTAFEDLILAVIDCLKDAWSELKTIILCIPTSLWNWITAFFENWKCLYQAPAGWGDCPKLAVYMLNCRFIIPSSCGPGSLGLTTGEVEIPFTELPTETITKIISECDLFELFSPEWRDCIDQTDISTSTAVVTRQADYSHIVKIAQKISDTEGNFGGILNIDDVFGWSTAKIGDLNNDGILDIAVGAPQDDDGGPDQGAIWILFLQHNGSVESYQKISNTTGDFSLAGGELADGDKFGYSVTEVGDLDSNGVTDLAVGAPFDDDGGSDQGAVWILFMEDTADGKVDNVQKISSLEGGFTGTLNDDDFFGASVAGLGDVDDDSIPDLAVGAHWDDEGGQNRGAVWILFLHRNGTVDRHRKIASSVGGGPTLENDGHFGASIALLGDLDHDGRVDIAVGAPENDDGGTNVGIVYVLFLQSSGAVKTTRRIAFTEPGFIETLGNEDAFGTSLATLSDLNGDGTPDLLVGAPGDDNGGSARGAVYIIFLFTDGTVRDITKISHTRGGFPSALRDSDRFGTSVAMIGDLDDDGIEDFVGGAPNDDDGVDNAGAVWVTYLGGELTRFRQPDDIVQNEARISDTAGQFDGILSNWDYFGWSVVGIGDLDGDGIVDMAVGAPGDDDNITTVGAKGAIWILFMTPGGAVKSHQKISESEGEFLGILADTDRFGTSIAALGDLDGDNVTDLAVGAKNDDDGGTDRGAVWILFLHSNGTVKSHAKISATAGGFTGTLNDLSNFGNGVAALGDLDGDNVTELAVGAPSDSDGGTGRGAIWILFLHSNGTVKSHAKISDTTAGFGGILDNDDQFGISVASVGDLDGDGVPDLAGGAWLDDDGGTHTGAIHVVFLHSNGTIKATQKISDEAGEFSGFLSDGDFFGSSIVSLGDLDGDGVVDLGVGAYLDNEGDLLRGAVWVLFLRPNGRVKDYRKISYFQGGFLGRPKNFDAFGFAIGTPGDLNGDGIPELLVGAPRADDGSILTNADRGAVWILYLREIERDRVTIGQHKISSLEGDFVGPLTNGDLFGASIATLGDLDGDNVTDIVVGAYLDDSAGGSHGAVWVLFLNADGTVKAEERITESSGGFVGPLDGNDFFGTSVGNLGDLDEDGVIDIAVGTVGDDDGIGLNQGALWVLFMHANGTVKSEQKISDTAGDFSGTLLDGDFFGSSVAAIGDLDGDNVTELAVGAIGDEDGGSDKGAVWILFMHSNGTVKNEQKISDTAGGFSGSMNINDNFGQSVAALGDLDGDGMFDIVVGAFLDRDGGSNRGAIWILFLASNGTVLSHQKISDREGDFDGILFTLDDFGYSGIAISDLNQDGIVDIAVGAPGDDDGGSARGSVWIIYLNTDGTTKAHTKISYEAGDFTGLLSGGDQFGSSIAMLDDFDGNGIPDLAVGARTDSDGGNQRGAVWIVLLADRSLSGPAQDGLDPYGGPDGVRQQVIAAAKKRRLNATTSWPALTTTWASSSSTTGPPEVIDFSDIERWCDEEGTHLASLRGAFGINTNSTQISEDQKEINRRLLNASVYQMGMSYHGCLASAAVSRIVDIGIGFVSKNETLVHPKTFYDPFRFFYFASRVIYVGPIVLEYHFKHVTVDPRTLTGGAFAAHLELEHNITDPLTNNLGLFGDRMIRAARLLVYRHKGSILGYLVNTFGELVYPPELPSGIARKKSRIRYGSAPLHPAGWQSPTWIDYRERYGGGILSGYAEWQRAVGYEDRTWTLDYLTELPAIAQRRLEWNQAGRNPPDEPPPIGRLAQRARFENLIERELAPRYAWESDETAKGRQLYARAMRQAKYPSLETAHVNRSQNLIPEDIICPIGISGSDHNCTVRACWSPDGATIGACTHRSDLLGRPICSCDYDSGNGACCGDTGCTDEPNLGNCSSDNVFAPNRTCAMTTTCTAARGACCAPNGTCATVSLSSRCPGNGTFLIGSGCSACADIALSEGACCDSGTCAMTTETTCPGTWNAQRNCASRYLSGECKHCGAAPCLSCDLLFATVNDIVDLWILNMELINKSATTGACCYGESAANRSCTLVARSTCDEKPASSWFWGEQCTFCASPFSFEVLSISPPRTVRTLNIERDLDRLTLDTFEIGINFVLEQGARWFPVLEGKSFDADAFVEDVSQFFFSNDGEDPKSWRYWFDNLLFCDVFDHLFPDVGPQGLGIVAGLFWATIALSLIYSLLFRCWPFLGSLLSGMILLMIWFMLVLVIAYFYSPACYGTFLHLPRYVVRGRTGSHQSKPASSPIAGAGAAVPVVGGRLSKLSSRVAAGLSRAKTIMKNASRQILLFMFSIPLIPVQLGQDVRDEILARFDIDCLPLCDVACPRENGKWPCAWVTEEDEGLNCLDAPDCCAVAECPEERVFPNCASDPYNFRSSTREFAYWARVLSPRWNCFFLHSDFFLFAWIRQIPSVAERLDFPGDECSGADFDDARWRYCARSNLFLLSPWLIVLLLFYIFIGAILLLTWVIFKAVAKLARRITSFWTAASRNAVRATMTPETGEKRSSSRSGGPVGSGPVLGHARERAPIKKE